MPELPDITVYIEALEERTLDESLEKARLKSPFLLRSVEPSLRDVEGSPVREIRRLGKRIVFGFDEDLFLVFHLMIAGRFRWKTKPGAGIPGRLGLAAFDFPRGTLLLTEASKKKRASLHVVRGEEGLMAHDPGGLEPLEATLESFRSALLFENHTVKRTLTDPRVFSGIGNAYSDEILHRARLSPLKWTSRLTEEEVERLYEATGHTLRHWIERLREERGSGFPEKVTAFRRGMAAHGRHKKPCPVCKTAIQRIAYADSETNYCPRCQTGGKVLADRGLSRLLKKDWPRTIEELEALRSS